MHTIQYKNHWLVVSLISYTLFTVTLSSLFNLNLFVTIDYSVSLIVLLFIQLLFSLYLSRKIFKKFDLFSPLVAFPILFFLIYGLGTLRWVFVIPKSYAGESLLYANIGFFSYLCAVLIQQLNNHNSSRSSTCDRKKMIHVVFVLTIVSIAGAIVFYSSAGIPLLRGSNILSGRLESYRIGGNRNLYFARLSTIAFILLFYYNLAEKRYRIVSINKKIIIIYFCFALCVMLSTASRHDLFLLLFMTMVGYSYLNNHKKIGGTIITSCLLIFTMPFVYGYYRLIVSDSIYLDWFISESTKLGLGNSHIGGLIMYMLAQFATYPKDYIFLISFFPDNMPFMKGELFQTTLETFLPGVQKAIDKYITEYAKYDLGGGVLTPQYWESYILSMA